MASDPLTAVSTRATPQSEQARPDQVPNSAGGWAFALDDWARLDRFLILGVEGGTYYVAERDLTAENAAVVRRCAEVDGLRLVERIVEVSEAGRAPKQNPTLFALSVAAGAPDPEVRRAACDAVGRVCRTGTHLFIFARYVEQFRGWGRQLRRAVADWYTSRPADGLAYQLVKYRQREGWSHRDLLRLSHPQAGPDEQRRALFAFACGADARLSGLVGAYQEAQDASPDRAVELIVGHRLPWEALPDRLLGSPAVWEALLPTLGQTALIRQLGRMSAIGLIRPMSQAAKQAAALVADPDRLRSGRVHPLAVLSALVTYAQGHGARGALTWTAAHEVVEALDSAFYDAFAAVTPAGKRTLLALDVSGSMTWPESLIMGGTVQARAGAAAMALVTAATEPEWHVMAFGTRFVELPVSPRQRLDDVIRLTEQVGVQGTDCSLPMRWAAHENVDVDTFCVYTDNETWAGGVHPHQALVAYRQQTGIDAKLIVVGMASNGFTIADPTDPGMLDVVGFDAAAPAAMAEFSRA